MMLCDTCCQFGRIVHILIIVNDIADIIFVVYVPTTVLSCGLIIRPVVSGYVRD